MATLSYIPQYDAYPYQEDTSAFPPMNAPRFSKLFNSVLGSPFLTTSDLPSSSDMTSTRSIQLDDDLETVDGSFYAVPRGHTITRPTSPTPSFRTETYSIVNWNESVDVYPSISSRPSVSDASPSCGAALRSSIWSSASATYFPYYTSTTPYNTMRFHSPTSMKGSKSLGLLPKLWDALRESSPTKKGKRRFDLSYESIWTELDAEGNIDYSNLPPLDGEEGELIDDEACFIDVRAVTGLDIVALIPEEIGLMVLSFLDVQDVISCLGVSRTWRRLAQDNAVWRSQFKRRKSDGWGVDLRRLKALTASYTTPSVRELDWHDLYRTRAELDQRWSATPRVGMGIPAEEKENAKLFEPHVKWITGHTDSVYCLEFDSSRIITGSRDRSIKVWSLKTGRCLATFKGHFGSVLCLKFDKDWDLDPANSLFDTDSSSVGREWRKGSMVSGSSDCNVCVWDMYTCPVEMQDEGGHLFYEMAVMAEVRGVLAGHTGGVLDIRIDQKWIVSCSKDATIRVWDRFTLAHVCTFRGHEGPVNAVGLQGNRVVSASGDGKMMLWDIESGERVRTFEGHDRGLACIEFKDDIIVSGSNDCKMKVWSASTGECLRTLVGHDMLVRALSFDSKSGRLVSGSYDRTVKVWDLKTGKMVREFKGCHVSHIFDVKFDGCRIVSTSHDQKIAVLDFTEGLDASLFT